MRRAALLAGRWYPADPHGCRDAVDRHSADAPRVGGDFAGLIGPHAGWAYSGDCAGRAYRALAAHNGDAELVVIFGSHRGPRDPSTVFLGDGWETPLGTLETDLELATELAGELSLSEEPVAPLRADNAVELHLPFVRRLFPGARFMMVDVAACERALAIGRRAGELARERRAVFVGSTDLTHYGPNYGFAPAGSGAGAVRWAREENDAGFLDAVTAGDSARALQHGLARHSACCPGAVAATMEAVRAYRGALAPALVDHYLSYDVRPDASFVGYASVVL